MGYNKKYDTYRPTDQERNAKMHQYQKENREKCKKSKTENWFWYCYAKPFMQRTGIKIKRQARRGTRIFDFWCAIKGIAIEIDGGYHNEYRKKKKDIKYDRYNKEVSGITVIRIQNWNDGQAREALKYITDADVWLDVRDDLGILTEAQKKKYKRKTFDDYIGEIKIPERKENKNKQKTVLDKLFPV